MQPIKKAGIFTIPVETAFQDAKNIKLLEEASVSLGEVNNFASGAIEYDFVMEALKNIESLTSAKIEGTTGNLQDLYAEESLSIERKKQLKLFSAINYRQAMSEVEEIIATYKRPSVAFIRHLHKLLTENDPATDGEPGKFRAGPVKIGNSKLGDFYPAHHLKVGEFMDVFTRQFRLHEYMPDLVRTAFSHYQFECIHPFEDGNGRTGRMLIVTELMMRKIIDFPVLNLSQYFESNRDEYLYCLRAASDTQSYAEWVRFFLNGVKYQSAHNIKLIQSLRDVERKDSYTINSRLHSPNASHVLRHALNKLFITVDSTAHFLQQQKVQSADYKQLARTNVQSLVKIGVLGEASFRQGTMKVYVHKELLAELTKKQSGGRS
jgi:Fic family protein